MIHSYQFRCKASQEKCLERQFPHQKTLIDDVIEQLLMNHSSKQPVTAFPPFEASCEKSLNTTARWWTANAAVPTYVAVPLSCLSILMEQICSFGDKKSKSGLRAEQEKKDEVCAKLSTAQTVCMQISLLNDQPAVESQVSLRSCNHRAHKQLRRRKNNKSEQLPTRMSRSSGHISRWKLRLGTQSDSQTRVVTLMMERRECERFFSFLYFPFFSTAKHTNKSTYTQTHARTYLLTHRLSWKF